MKKIELLAPAKNLEQGKIAINYGADAVYIGADKFGARAAAGNSVKDIERLVQYAHKYRAKVFVTLNTILYNKELKEGEKLIHQIYAAGADALIIQDLGILKMNLPPIALHASTQTNNFSQERIHFLDQLDLERIVLARELTITEIKKISQQTKAELEYFVHGALCVSLSGQCYFSQAITGRSANRGMCAQMCRHPYNLLDAQGNKLALNSHLLSLKDLNLSKKLKQLIEAGITSLKIEGRLKDEHYVKNVVSYYRQQLDVIFESDKEYTKASSGHTEIKFEPDPERSFNRQSSEYFTDGRKQALVNTASPKAMGKEIGKVDKINSDSIVMEGKTDLTNGDGLCFIQNNELIGLRVEKVEDKKVYINDLSKLKKGTVLFRNYDNNFNKLLEADKSVRKVSASIRIYEQNDSLIFELTDLDHQISQYALSPVPDLANNFALANKNLNAQLSKSGDSMFKIESVTYECKQAYFLRMSELNEIRRTLFKQHEQLRIKTFTSEDKIRNEQKAVFPKTVVDFSENISNSLSAEFHREHGVERQETSLETGQLKPDQLLMTTRYCLKYELGYCTRFQSAKNTPPEPLFLQDQNRKYLLQFDCKNCLMHIRLHQEN